MSFIPNARTGERGYSDKDLRGDRREYLRGYDNAIEDILNLKNNLDVYSTDSLVFHYLEENADKVEELFKGIEAWAELSRNEVAVALLDNQVDEDSKED